MDYLPAKYNFTPQGGIKEPAIMDMEPVGRYARFVVRNGCNLQPGQTLLINCPLEAAWFARLCAAEGYTAGARDVVVHYADERFSRLRLERAAPEVLEDVKPWILASRMDYYAGETSLARLAIVGGDPEIYKGLDPAKVECAAQAQHRALKPWSDLSMANHMQWCVAGVPTAAWAQKVFAGLSGEAAFEKLWQAILTATRMLLPDPEAAWREHSEQAQRRILQLNSMNIDTLHLVGENGTNLRVGLADGYLFEGVVSQRTDGLPFLANLPSEEVFTAPHRDRVDGLVKSSLPYVYNGNLIEGITARFEHGVAVEASAKKGGELLERMMSADEGARRLGEIALVPASSPIRASGVLFYNTLFDENAACHMAFGAGYPISLKDSGGCSREQLLARGLNDSLIHEDVMIGTPGMNVTALCAGGEQVPVFRDGEWAL
jgi:aminopeptidase